MTTHITNDLLEIAQANVEAYFTTYNSDILTDDQAETLAKYFCIIEKSMSNVKQWLHQITTNVIRKRIHGSLIDYYLKYSSSSEPLFRPFRNDGKVFVKL